MRVHVLLDCIDRQQRRLQFALIPDAAAAPVKNARRSKTAASATGERPHSSPKRTGKKKARVKAKKSKGQEALGRCASNPSSRFSLFVIPVGNPRGAAANFRHSDLSRLL